MSPTCAPPAPKAKPNPTVAGFISPYKASSLKAISAAPKVPPAVKLAILPSFAILAQGIKKVTGSANPTEILPAITPAVSGLPLNSPNSSNILSCLASSIL